MIINPKTGAECESKDDLLEVMQEVQRLSDAVNDATRRVGALTEELKAAKKDLGTAQDNLRVFVADTRGTSNLTIRFRPAV